MLMRAAELNSVGHRITNNRDTNVGGGLVGKRGFIGCGRVMSEGTRGENDQNVLYTHVKLSKKKIIFKIAGCGGAHF